MIGGEEVVIPMTGETEQEIERERECDGGGRRREGEN